MPVFRTFLGNCLALVAFSCATVHADRFEFTLHDHQIKKDLATFGLNLDAAWQEIFDADGNIQEDKRSELSQKIADLGQHAHIEPPTAQIPSNAQDFATIFNNLNYQDADYNFLDNKSNKENFEKLLEDAPCAKVITINEDSVNIIGLFQEIVIGICTYISTEAISSRLDANKEKIRESLHIYIKLIFDTDEKTITFQTVPYAAQDGFVRTYSEEDVEKWLEEEEKQKEAPKPIPLSSFAPRTPKTRSCCATTTKFVCISAVVLGLSILANSYFSVVDTNNLTELVDTQALSDYAGEIAITDFVGQITEFFGNLNITQ